MGGEVLEHDGEPVGGVRADGREPVDDVVARIAAGAEELTRAGCHLHPSLEPDETGHDRCDRLDRDFERLGVVAVGMHVEHDRGAGTPARFVLADHEVAGARGRAPVHAAQVVAELVLAQREELVAEVARHRPAAREGRSRRRRGSPRRPAPRSRVPGAARARRCQPRSAPRAARGRRGHSPRAKRPDAVPARAGVWGRGMRPGRWPRPRAAAR